MRELHILFGRLFGDDGSLIWDDGDRLVVRAERQLLWTRHAVEALQLLVLFSLPRISHIIGAIHHDEEMQHKGDLKTEPNEQADTPANTAEQRR